jgi:hypothetical protein
MRTERGTLIAVLELLNDASFVYFYFVGYALFFLLFVHLCVPILMCNTLIFWISIGILLVLCISELIPFSGLTLALFFLFGIFCG